MNDISVKIVESVKEQPVGDETPSAGILADNAVDPLAIEDSAVGVSKTPLNEEGTPEIVIKAGICDENAKDEKSSESDRKECDKLVALQAERIKEELLKEDSNSPCFVEPSEEKATLVHDAETPVEAEQTEPVAEPVAADEEPMTVDEPVKEPETVAVAEAPKTVIPVETPPPKEPSPPKEVLPVVEVPSTVETDVEMNETPKADDKPEPPKDPKPKKESVNGDVSKGSHKDDQSSKRRASEDVETDSPLKKLYQEVEKAFPQHDVMINDYIQTATKNNIEEIQKHTEQLLAEIQTLRELAQKKEQEWNNILHLKKVKEEILLRLLRRKQVLSFEKAAEVNGSDRTDPFDYLNQAKNLAIDKSDEISGLSIKQPGPSSMSPMMQPQVMPVTSHFNPMSGLPPPYDKAAHMQNMPKPVYPQPMMMPGPMPGFPRDMNGQLPTGYNMPMGRQGPTKDVKSIIADYRQRNPEMTPRRGRRMKSILNPNMMGAPRPIAPKMDSMNNLNNLNMLFNNLDMNQKAMLERLQQIQAGGLPNGLSFKDVLVQFANMQQSSSGLIPPRPEPPRPEPHARPEPRRRPEPRHEEMHPPPKQVERLASPSPRLPPPPPYPEISLLPVTTQESQTSQQNSLLHGILTKSCGEITITPVQPAPPPAPDPQPEKPEEVVQLQDDEESPGSSGSGGGSPAGSGSGSGSGRLVIDEQAAAQPSPDDAPLCQGCRRRDAQFVCAGCANQWYCSRDCQVAAWDEHSEMCSG
ncbi:actin cytoskeleton-regulatory complex protein PAN1-like isoform X2 [Ostrinia furnacalis]|uniref:actin cytoskeleton-regulatory complex protein PAN1-like isoform X2 n=1 Tax=Ostrinia furnacalis TaxID=93504 RepID=UPI00103A6AF7|nr:actin cytoskeleton-regulatory complex protein PAN1-like isoform X2 [Ostrinia furnacalis]